MPFPSWWAATEPEAKHSDPPPQHARRSSLRQAVAADEPAVYRKELQMQAAQSAALKSALKAEERRASQSEIRETAEKQEAERRNERQLREKKREALRRDIDRQIQERAERAARERADEENLHRLEQDSLAKWHQQQEEEAARKKALVAEEAAQRHREAEELQRRKKELRYAHLEEDKAAQAAMSALLDRQEDARSRTLRNTFEHEPAKDTVARRQAQQDPQLLALHLEAQGKKQQQFEDFRRTLAQQVEAKTVAKMRQREADCAFAAKMKEDALRAEQEEQRRVAERRQRSMENRAFLEEQIRAKKLAAPGRHAGSIAFSAPAALQLPQPQQLPPPPQQQQQQQQQQTRSTRPW